MMEDYKLYEDDNIIFARMFFNSWDWAKGDPKSAKDHISFLDRIARLMLKEENAKF
jgi:hypothetical protein